MDKRQKLEEVSLAELIEMYLETTPGKWTYRSFDESQAVIIPVEPVDKKQALIAIMSIGEYRPNGDANTKFVPSVKNSFPQLIQMLVVATERNMPLSDTINPVVMALSKLEIPLSLYMKLIASMDVG